MTCYYVTYVILEEGRCLSESGSASIDENKKDPKAMVPYSSFFIFSQDNP